MAGTYVEFAVNQESEDAINGWLASMGFSSRKNLHVTTVYSRKPVDYRPKVAVARVITQPEEYGFIFLKSDLGLCMCLSIENLLFHLSHTKAERLGATWDYPTYLPHLTLAYDISESDFLGRRLTLPDFTITFSGEMVSELNEDWKP